MRKTIVIMFAGLVFSMVGCDQLTTKNAIVRDGDTLVINSKNVRLYGIDAPEYNQQCENAEGIIWECGLEAKKFLENKVADQKISCEAKDNDNYNRPVAVCVVSGSDINRMMVEEGMAIAYRYFSRDYVGAEESAKKSKKGIWNGRFIEPYKWRRGDRLETENNPTDSVKKSEAGVCHDQNSKDYMKIKNFIAYESIEECLKPGGRPLKK